MSIVDILLLASAAVLALLVIAVSLSLPIARRQRHKITGLLELVVAGRATVADWQTLITMASAAEAAFPGLRERFRDIEASEYIGKTGFTTRQGRLFTQRGLDRLAAELQMLCAEQTGGAANLHAAGLDGGNQLR